MQNAHVVIITAVYPPEPVVSARMAYDLATFLLSQGVSVTVLCPQPSRPLGADYTAYLRTNPFISVEDGVSVVRLPSYSSPKSKFLPRFYESFSFGKHACDYLAKNGLKPCVLYVNVWPVLAQLSISRYAKMHAIPMVLQIMDIYPESLLNKLSLPARVIISKPLEMVDAWIANMASTVIVISENMRRVYAENRKVPQDKLLKIYTWQDETQFANLPSKQVACRQYGINPEKFTFLYLGNIGNVAGVDFLIRAFVAADLNSAQLIVVGDGAAKDACIELANRLDATNIHFISDPNAVNVPLLQGMADVCMLPIKKGAGLSSIPSKLPAYLFSAKPIIATVDLDSDTAELLSTAKCCWVGEPENLTWLITAMKEVFALPHADLDQLGRNGREFGLNHFSRVNGVKLLAKAILQAGVNYRREV